MSENPTETIRNPLNNAGAPKELGAASSIKTTTPTPKRARFRIFGGWGMLFIGIVAASVWCERLIRYKHDRAIAEFSRECQILSKDQTWDELAVMSERWSRVEPLKAEPWLFRAEAAENRGEWENLISYLDQIPRSDRRSIAALVRKAAAEFEYVNRPWDGMKTCDEVLALDPRVLLAHKQVIFFQVMTLQRAELVRRIRNAIRLRRESPWAYAYLASSSWIYSASLYRQNTRWLESDPDNETFLVARALHVYTADMKSDLERASEFEDIPPAEDMLKRFPQNLELIAFFLNRSITEGDVEAVQDFLQRLPRERTDGDPRFWRGRAWVEDTLGQLESAERSLRRAFELDPYWWKIHFQLHDLLRRQGKLEESSRFLRIHKAAWDLSVEIMTSNKTIDTLDESKICRMMLELAELVGDHVVVAVLKDRVKVL
jgi:tetratricopeptide (TPR) repeat protein